MKEIDLPKELTDKLITIALNTEIGQEIIKAFLLGKDIKGSRVSIDGQLQMKIDD